MSLEERKKKVPFMSVRAIITNEINCVRTYTEQRRKDYNDYIKRGISIGRIKKKEKIRSRTANPSRRESARIGNAIVGLQIN